MAKFHSAGKRLKSARIAAGFKTAREFCLAHKIPASTYSLHENGRRLLKPAVATRYAEILGINVVWLLTGTGSPYLPGEQQHLSTASEGNPAAGLLMSLSGLKIQDYARPEDMEPLSVNPVVYCKIIIGVMAALHELCYKLDLTQISLESIRIYRDITTSADDIREQLAMVNLATTLFKRQISEHLSKDKTAAEA